VTGTDRRLRSPVRRGHIVPASFSTASPRQWHRPTPEGPIAISIDRPVDWIDEHVAAVLTTPAAMC
jgi:hypothetical protein